ncbi:MAG: low-specificity L-threonine aldolase [Caldilineales bacterium]|nr:low-specificity L-threonine aldolase [Caldilineales bacterium]
MTQFTPTPPRIDLRSDTFTLPTPAMREAMANADVGDDVFGEDPTVNRLQAMAAERMGKEAALFVGSGTQGNLVSLLSHCGRGDEAIMGDQAHTFIFEQGGSAVLGGIHPRTVRNQPDGTLALNDIENAIRADNEHFPVSRLVCLENTHNRTGGAYLTPDYTRTVADLAHAHGLKLHIDGARIFNAAVAQNVDVRALVDGADSVTFCLSKGLSAPVGSLVCGSEDFIRKVKRARKVLGGGMRQAGIIAAAGIIALSEMVERLADDHANARRLAEGIATLPGIELDPATVQTNIVIFGIDHPAIDAAALQSELRRREVGVLSIGGRQLRAVTHYGIESGHIDEAIAAFADILVS